MLKIILVIIILLPFIFLHPYLYFVNGILMRHCHNQAFLTDEEKLKIFPISQKIEINYPNIKNDFINYPHPIPTFNKMLPEFSVSDEKRWKIIPLKTTGKIIQSNLPFFPSLKNILTNPSIHNAFFSVMEPKCKIPTHIGPYKGYLRYHLGIIIPDGPQKPYIVVDNQIYNWREGEGIMFDDMFSHYVENPTEKRRVVLFIDVIRPLNGLMKYLNEFSIFIIENHPVMKKIQKIQHNSIKI